MRSAEVRLRLTEGKWGRSHPADIAGCSPCRTALYTTPSQPALTETDVPTLSPLHHFTFDHNLALFYPIVTDAPSRRRKSLQLGTGRMVASPALIFIGCKYFRSQTKTNNGQFSRTESHISHCFLCNFSDAELYKGKETLFYAANRFFFGVCFT